MKYRIIEKPKQRGYIIKNKGVGIQKQNITFHRGFIEKYGIKKWCDFAENDNGYLRFRLSDTESLNSYKIYKTPTGAYVIHLPRVVREKVVQFAKYDVEKDGDWFVTNCKLK